MNQLIRKNVIFPISLHDAKISSILIQPASPEGLIDGGLTLVFDEGFYRIDNGVEKQISNALIKFSGIDFDYSLVYYFKDNIRQKISFEQFAKDVELLTVSVLDETYGYNHSKYHCTMYKDNDWHDVQIEIYHFKEIVYEWEEKSEER